MQETAEMQWLVRWFESNTEFVAEPAVDPDLNYFERGLVDSMEVIELIEAIETHFDIRFNEDHFQDRRFSTIGGLAAIVTELVDGKDGSA